MRRGPGTAAQSSWECLVSGGAQGWAGWGCACIALAQRRWALRPLAAQAVLQAHDAALFGGGGSQASGVQVRQLPPLPRGCSWVHY